MALLEIENLSAFYGKAQALGGVSLHVEEGETIAIVGANGAGKSTLLDSIMGMVRVEGVMRFGEEVINGSKPADMARRGIGYAPERCNLFPYMSVRDNLLVGAFSARTDMAGNLDLVHRLFPNLEKRKHQETATQSGGERQMVSLGRALMTSPRLLLVDEPTLGLAPKICAEIAAVLCRLSGETGLTVVIAEQNANFALALAQRLYVLEGGQVTANGTAKELSSNDQLARSYFGA